MKGERVTAEIDETKESKRYARGRRCPEREGESVPEGREGEIAP